MLRRIRPIFANPMNLMLPMAVVPVRVNAVRVSSGWIFISTVLTLIPLALTFVLLH